MKKNFNISIIITVATIIFSIGGSFAVIQLKANEVDDVKKKADATELKVATLDTKLDDLKEAVKEQKDDLKAILRAVKK